MENAKVYQILKMKYGSINDLAIATNVTMQTIRNILTTDYKSNYRDIVEAKAREMAAQILEKYKNNIQAQIENLTAEIQVCEEMRLALVA